MPWNTHQVRGPVLSADTEIVKSEGELTRADGFHRELLADSVIRDSHTVRSRDSKPTDKTIFNYKREDVVVTHSTKDSVAVKTTYDSKGL